MLWRLPARLPSLSAPTSYLLPPPKHTHTLIHTPHPPFPPTQAHHELGQYEEAVRDYEALARLDDAYPGLGDMLNQARMALKKSKRVDYYAILGVPPSVDEGDVKKAYRKAALLHHPDKAGAGAGEEERAAAEARFKLVGEAFAVLSDPAKRRRYDAGWTLEEIEQGHPSGGGGGGCSHGGGFGGGFGRHGSGFGGGYDEEELFARLFATGYGGGGGRRGGPRATSSSYF